MPSASALPAIVASTLAAATVIACAPEARQSPAARPVEPTAAAGSGPTQTRSDASPADARASTGPPSGAPAPPPTSPPVTSRPPAPSAPPPPTPVVEQGSGVLTEVPGTGSVSGPGEPTAYVVEVEGGLGVDPRAFAREVDRVLTDPRSWGAGGRRALQRVPSGDVALRVALVSPETADRLCAPLQTNGYFSCGTSDRAVLNVARWLTGADAYGGDLGSYRSYLVNHEVGHVLGRGHEQCPGRGQPAPVMLQQTKGLDGCAANSWPYP